MKTIIMATAILFSCGVFAAEPMETANRARASVSMKLHLMAADLLDEMAYRWSKTPPLDRPEDVMVMAIQSPLGINASFSSFLENHLFRLLIHQKKTHIVPVHCPSCSITTAYATTEGTIISRGADNPRVHNKNGMNALYALYVDFSIESSHLVLRARLVSLDEQRRIVHAETISTDSGQPPSLRRIHKLESTKEARERYENILRGRSPTKLALGTDIMNLQFKDKSIIIPPIPWFTLGLEVFPTDQHDWFMNFYLGVSSVPKQVNGRKVGGIYGTRLLPKRSNLIQPELYGAIGMEYMELEGPIGKTLIGSNKKTPAEFLNLIRSEDSELKFSSMSLKVGLEVRLATTMRMGFYVGQMVQVRESKMFDDIHFYSINLGVHL